MGVAIDRNGAASTNADDSGMSDEQLERYVRLNKVRTQSAVAIRSFQKEIVLLEEKLLATPEYRKMEQYKRKIALMRQRDREATIELNALMNDVYTKKNKGGKRMVDFWDEVISDQPKRLPGRPKK